MKKRRLATIYAVFIIGSILILLAPWLVRDYFKISNFSVSGPLGDTIGGITAPLTGLLGAFLVFQALLAQIDANKLITDQFTEQKIMNIVIEQLKILREEINDLRMESTYWIKDGSEVVETVLDGIRNRHTDPEMDNWVDYSSREREIEFFLNSICYLIGLVNSAKLKENDRQNLIGIILETYKSKLRDPLVKNEKKRESKQTVCKECGKIHGIKENVYALYDKIEREIATIN